MFFHPQRCFVLCSPLHPGAAMHTPKEDAQAETLSDCSSHILILGSAAACEDVQGVSGPLFRVAPWHGLAWPGTSSTSRVTQLSC